MIKGASHSLLPTRGHLEGVWILPQSRGSATAVCLLPLQDTHPIVLTSTTTRALVPESKNPISDPFGD